MLEIGHKVYFYEFRFLFCSERMHVFNDANTKFVQPSEGTRNVQIMDRGPPNLLTEISDLHNHRLSFNEEETANLTFPPRTTGLPLVKIKRKLGEKGCQYLAGGKDRAGGCKKVKTFCSADLFQGIG